MRYRICIGSCVIYKEKMLLIVRKLSSRNILLITYILCTLKYLDITKLVYVPTGASYKNNQQNVKTKEKHFFFVYFILKFRTFNNENNANQNSIYKHWNLHN